MAGKRKTRGSSKGRPQTEGARSQQGENSAFSNISLTQCSESVELQQN
ncbi:hypothetical protein SLEP1_g30660 [Rubroshorea leprosula]|uniref:Uncharacterized protein n=1 Tax=Rubroshorea leprosula TaxID=152421 RepID=A0AAV5K0U9_9ROSI|nr:hypothetical protein SLEP1_g30660 [Rubroshorea leprosula]